MILGIGFRRFITLAATDYHKISNIFLENLITQLDIEDFYDLNHSEGVVTLKATKDLIYVINKQTPNKEIWIVSPFSGTGRYEYNGSFWANTNDGKKLVELLSEELSSVIKREIVINEEA